MISIFLTEELNRHTTDSEVSDLIFFFCGAGDENRYTAVNILRGLVHQILEKRLQLIGHALAYFTPPERARQTLSSLEALWLIFSKLVADVRLGTIFCVIDGLDECEQETTRSLLRRILDLLAVQCSNQAESMFRLAIVSRDIPVLRGCTKVKLDPDNNQEIESDISTFVRTRVKDLSWIEGFEHIQESVQAALIKRAEGTFQWVGFAMHELLQKRTCKQILETLKSLPSGLPAIYGRMLLRIPRDQRASTRTLLQWVAFAARPLRLPELAATIYMPKSLPQVEMEQVTRDLIILCGPLLRTEVPREDFKSNIEIVRGQEVNLVRQSVRDYLSHSDCDSHPVLETFRFDNAITHLQLAHRCLDFIEQERVQNGPYLFDPDETPQRWENPLLRYAALHWFEHAKESSALATKVFKSHGLFQPRNKALRRAWWKSYKDYLNNSRYLIPPPPLLHMACILELIPLVEVVLGHQEWRPRMHRRINQKHEGIATPLHIAVWQDNLALVRLLLQKGANFNIKDNGNLTPLESACFRSNEAVVRLLLDKGAKPTPRSPDFDVLLLIAVMGRNQAVLRLLLDMGARPTVQDADNLLALHYAAIEGSSAMKKLLIDKGADVKAKTSLGESPLHLAASASAEASVEVVQILLDCGADMNARDSNGCTPLSIAADIKTKNLSGHGILYEAAKPRKPRYPSKQDKQMKTMQLLLERGADVEELNNESEAAAYRNCKRLLGERSDAWEFD